MIDLWNAGELILRKALEMKWWHHEFHVCLSLYAAHRGTQTSYFNSSLFMLLQSQTLIHIPIWLTAQLLPNSKNYTEKIYLWQFIFMKSIHFMKFHNYVRIFFMTEIIGAYTRCLVFLARLHLWPSYYSLKHSNLRCPTAFLAIPDIFWTNTA